METEHGFWDKGLMDIYELDVDNYPNGVPHSEWLEMIHPSDRARVKQYLSDARSSKTQMDMTFKIITAKTQTLKHIRGTGTFSIDKNGKVDSIYGTNWDITRDVKLSEERALALEELKEAQSFLVQSEKMASLGILTAGVAQELNNPLNYITGGL